MGYEIGRIYGGKEINKVGKHIFDPCPSCEKPRMARLSDKGRLCGSCATIKSHQNNPRIGRGENHYNWKGGINKSRDGYVIEYVKKTNRLYPMATNTKDRTAGGYILQHRLVMAKYIGRLLTSGEIVHHINGIKDDNRISNLKLIDRGNHGINYAAGYREGCIQAMKDNNKKWNGEAWEK